MQLRGSLNALKCLHAFFWPRISGIPVLASLPSPLDGIAFCCVIPWFSLKLGLGLGCRGLVWEGNRAAFCIHFVVRGEKECGDHFQAGMTNMCEVEVWLEVVGSSKKELPGTKSWGFCFLIRNDILAVCMSLPFLSTVYCGSTLNIVTNQKFPRICCCCECQIGLERDLEWARESLKLGAMGCIH